LRFLVPLKDEHALLNAIKKLLDDASLCDKFGQAGRELVIREFSQQKIASETKKIWEEVLS
jgi:glycosyltransferase involved in cell wall biosynthesis